MKTLWLFVMTLGPLYAEKSVPIDLPEAAYPALERFVEVLETVRKRHPDLDKLTYDRLVNQALDGMLSSLDAHSSFIHPEMRQMVTKEGTLDNEVKSLGMSLGRDSDKIFIAAVAKSGVAEKAGILPHTTILALNGVPVSDLKLEDALSMLQREPGEKTILTLKNPERPGQLVVSLTHHFVEQGSLIQSRLLEKHPETGYLRLAQFGAGSAREIESALDDLEDKGMRSLILDLRENGGGDLAETVKILGLFVPPSTAVVSVRERDKAEEFLKTSDRQRRKREYPLFILIDRNSASASELTAGALHDLQRATIIGERSYGKGSVQNIVPMGNHTALRLTIATYHTPSGNTPHLKGIEPDVVLKFSETDRQNFLNAARPSAMDEEQREEFATWDDPAIKAALDAL